MTKDVLITITGTHTIDGEEQEPVVTSARGKYACRAGHHYVQYEEELPDGEGSARSLVKFTDKYLCVTRKGDYASRMEFREGRRQRTEYRTPAGNLEFDLEAEHIEYEEDAHHLEIRVTYAMHSGKDKIQDSRVTVSVRPYPIL